MEAAAILALGAALTLFSAGCQQTSSHSSSSSTGDAPRLAPDSDGNFVLYVANQSSERRDVDVEIWIDDRLAVRDHFHYAPPESQQRAEYRFRLAEGEHVLRAVSSDGEARAEERFTLAGRRWALVNYFFSSGGKRGVRVEPGFLVQVLENQPGWQ